MNKEIKDSIGEDIARKWQEIKNLINELDVDIEKASKGNKAAGLRYRKRYKWFCLLLKELKNLTLLLSKK